jgi:hypothetical protein
MLPCEPIIMATQLEAIILLFLLRIVEIRLGLLEIDVRAPPPYPLSRLLEVHLSQFKMSY